jgi:uncharacterized protein YndB with AHSA1/START domain
MALKTETIRQKEHIPAKPLEVYEAFVDPKKHAAFTGARASGEQRLNGTFTAWDEYITGKHLDLQPGRRLLQEWITANWPEGYPPSTLEFVFEEKDDGTDVTMVHSNVPSEQANAYRKGWVDHYWNPLKKHFSKKGRP